MSWLRNGWSTLADSKPENVTEIPVAGRDLDPRTSTPTTRRCRCLRSRYIWAIESAQRHASSRSRGVRFFEALGQGAVGAAEFIGARHDEHRDRFSQGVPPMNSSSQKRYSKTPTLQTASNKGRADFRRRLVPRGWDGSKRTKNGRPDCEENPMAVGTAKTSRKMVRGRPIAGASINLPPATSRVPASAIKVQPLSPAW